MSYINIQLITFNIKYEINKHAYLVYISVYDADMFGDRAFSGIDPFNLYDMSCLQPLKSNFTFK